MSDEFIREIISISDPALLREWFVRRCDQFDLAVVRAIKEWIDEVNRAEPRRALALAEAGLAAAEACSNPTARAWMLWARAHAQMQLEEYQAGLASCDAALALLRSQGDAHTAARVEVSRLFALVNLGREEAVIRSSDAIRAALEQYDDQYALARLEMNMGIAYDNTDRHGQALQCFESAAARFEALGRPLEVLRARINSAIALENLDRYDDALAVYTEIRPALVALDKPMVLARNDFNMAVLHFWLGDYARALGEFEAARRAFSRLNVSAEMDQVDLYRALLYLELNQFSEVIATCSEVERRASERGIIRDVILAKWFAAVAYGYRRWPGDWSTAIALLKEAQSLARERDAHLQAARMDLDIALLLLERGLPDQALPLARRSLDRFSERGLPVKQARAHIVCGRCLMDLGRWEEAEEHFHRALAVAERLSLIQLAFRCHHGLAQLAEARRNHRAARHHYDLAVEGIERLRRRILVDDFRASFLEDKLQVYADAAHLCWENGDVASAFDYVERAKARVLLDLISASAPSTSQVEPKAVAAVREQLRRLERRWNAMQSRQLPDPREAPGQERLNGTDEISPRFRRALIELEREVIALRRELQVLNPTLAGLTGEAVLDLAEVQRRLDDDVTLLEYFVDGERIVAFVVTENHCRFRVLEARPGEVMLAVRDLLTDLQAYQPKWDLSILKRLRSLYDHLLRPVCPLLNTRRLVLIPHGFLCHVPFSALHDGDRWVVEAFECSYTPSATVYALCEGRAPGGTRDVIFAFSDGGRIPGTLEEAARLSGILSDALILREKAATLEGLNRHCRQARVLHLATHGHFRGDNPLFSTLRLADADLTVRQVYDLRLRASLVTLSGCETGLGHLRGSDLIGLAGAFLYAGAASLVVSLWHAHDESTIHLMEVLYRNLMRGRRKAAALRAAQMELLSKSEFRAPFFWAPFVLYGDTGPL